MRVCQESFAQWLRDQGFVKAPPASGVADGPCSDVLFRARIEDIQGSRRAACVFQCFLWLTYDVLPALADRAATLRDRGQGVPTTDDVLFFGDDETELGLELRGVLAQFERLLPQIVHVARRMRLREQQVQQLHTAFAEELIRPDGATLVAAAINVLEALKLMRTLVVPTGSPRRPVPLTVEDWQQRRTELEVSLFEAGFTDNEIVELLPRSGDASQVKQRRYRRRRGAPGNAQGRPH